MPREPLRLTAETIALHRPGGLVAVAVGALAGIPRRRPTPYAIPVRSRAYTDLGPTAPRSPSRASAPETAIIPIRGVLEQRGQDSQCGQTCGYDTIEADILGSMADPGVEQGILDVDSNGGDVPGLEQGGARIRAGLDRLGKPLIGYVNEKAFSAAFWLMAMVCDAIYLPPSGRIGSIGSIVTFGSHARRLEKDGIDIYIGRRPGGKAKPAPEEPLDDVGKARIDRLADEGAARFLAAVEALRGIPMAVAEGWNGDAFTGAAAVEAGLADGVGSLDEVIALAEAWPRKRTEAA